MEHALAAQQPVNNVISVDFAHRQALKQPRLALCSPGRFDEICAEEGVRITFTKLGDCMVKKNGRLVVVLVWSYKDGNKHYAA